LSFAISVRAVLLMLAGAFLFLFALLCTIAFLAESHCGERFGYYGCVLH
jgi:type IV secretory pathway TrbL component